MTRIQLRSPDEPLCPSGAGPQKSGRVVISRRFLLFWFPLFLGSFQEGGPLWGSLGLRVGYIPLVEVRCGFSCYLLLFLFGATRGGFFSQACGGGF